jgi:hypothetical protein
MSALAHLRSLARGELPPDDGLLNNARCAWGRGEVVSQEAVVAAFSANRFAIDSDVLVVETGQGAAMVGNDDAVVADLYDGRIGRLWRVGRGVAMPHEPGIDVAFDPDMHQQRGDVFFRAEDHPDLDPAAAERLVAAARAHGEEVRAQGKLRVRAFVVRAFGSRKRCAALLAVHVLTNERTRSASFGYAVVGLGSDDAYRVVSEQSRPRPWTPRI